VTKSLIQKTKRARVNGPGPKRNEMLTFAKIGDVDPELLEQLKSILLENPQNDLGGDGYNISQQCDIENVFNAADSYRQVLIQKSIHDENTASEFDYSDYVYDVKVPWFKSIYRLRLSHMGPGHTINWHIDTDTSVMCRAQICLNENDSVFKFKTKSGVESFTMKPGEMWFINTGWPHSVEGGKTERSVAIFGFEYRDYNGNTNLLRS
jgi:hypothetical protein